MKMSNICGNYFNQSVFIDCDLPMLSGRLDGEAYLIDRSDITAFTIEDGICTALTIASGSKVRVVQMKGKKPFTGSSNTMVESDYGNRWDNVLQFIIAQPVVNDKVEPIIEELKDCDLVAIIKNKDVYSGLSSYEIWGLSQGMQATAIVRTFYDENVGGAWTVTLTESGADRTAVRFLESDSDVATWLTGKVDTPA